MNRKPSPGAEKYAGVIREARRAAGMSQQELADRAGVSRNTVAGWETGHSRPELDSVPALCGALGLPLASFFGVRDRFSREERQLLTAFRAMGAGDRQVLLWQAEAVAAARTAEKTAAPVRRNAAPAPFRGEIVRRETVKVWKSDLSAAAGTGVPLDAERGEAVLLYKDALTSRADEILTVNGHSMEPTFRDGDLVLVEHTESLRPGEIGVFVVNGEGYVKEYQPDGLHSHNPEYPVMRFGEDSEVRCVGRVLGRLEVDQTVSAEEAEGMEGEE